MKLFTTNQNKSERVLRFILSVFLIPAPIVYQFDPFSIVQSVVGGILLFNALVGTCMIYKLMGVDTCMEREDSAPGLNRLEGQGCLTFPEKRPLWAPRGSQRHPSFHCSTPLLTAN